MASSHDLEADFKPNKRTRDRKLFWENDSQLWISEACEYFPEKK